MLQYSDNVPPYTVTMQTFVFYYQTAVVFIVPSFLPVAVQAMKSCVCMGQQVMQSWSGVSK